MERLTPALVGVFTGVVFFNALWEGFPTLPVLYLSLIHIFFHSFDHLRRTFLNNFLHQPQIFVVMIKGIGVVFSN